MEWIEDLDTRVKIAKTALEDVRGLIRVRLSSPPTAFRSIRPPTA